MSNLLIILAVLFAALFLLLPILEKTAKPVDEEQAQNYSKIIMVLMAVMILASTIKMCTGG
jgi:uncharacterized membrane protein required for colicin V production